MFNYLMGTATNDYQINVSKQMLLFFRIKIKLRMVALLTQWHALKCERGGGCMLRSN